MKETGMDSKQKLWPGRSQALAFTASESKALGQETYICKELRRQGLEEGRFSLCMLLGW